MVKPEGMIYKRLTVGGHEFVLRYGYYDEHDRQHTSPVVVYPDFGEHPRHSPEGFPLVTQIQDPCPYYRTAEGREERWCGDCLWFSGEHREIGVCLNGNNRKMEEEAQ